MPKSMNTDQKRRAREHLIKQQGMYCYLCGAELCNTKSIMSREESKRIVTVEHKVPLTRGGTNNIDNLALACASCNMIKGNKTVEEYKTYVEQKGDG